jgi:hypothetical protein
MIKRLLSLTMMLSLVAMFTESKAQTRYVDEIFDNVMRTSNIEYDTNRSVNILFGIVPGQQPIVTASLRCDIYEPDGDTVGSRPVILLAHTGSYLPAIINRQPTGNKSDSTIVELATKLAKRGYVVVAFNYRLGWNPQTTDQEQATEQLLKATYRGMQDARNVVRYLSTVSDTYKLDMSKVVLGGQGTGGYIALAVATVDSRAEIESNLKFLRGNATPMVNADTLGDWTGLGGNPFFNYGGDTAAGDDIHMVFNYGGAMGDSAWLEAANLPIVSLHCFSDPFAPYNTGNVIVPTTNVTVIPAASGAGDVVARANRIGVNAKLNASFFEDDITTIAEGYSAGEKHVFRFNTATDEGAPWEWWDRAIVQSINSPAPGAGYLADSLGMKNNPNMSAAKAKAYIDTIARFVAPRIAAQLDLADFSVGLNKVASYNNAIQVFPNPAKGNVNFYLPIMMSTITIVDVMGREVATFNNINNKEYTANLNSIQPGMYFVNVIAADGKSAVKRLIVE